MATSGRSPPTTAPPIQALLIKVHELIVQAGELLNYFEGVGPDGSKLEQNVNPEGLNIDSLKAKVSTLHPEKIELISAYVSNFAVLQAELTRIEPATLEDTDLTQLKKLETLHAKVLLQADKLKGEVGESLKGIRKIGKGIIAYSDSLPKRISLRGVKQG